MAETMELTKKRRKKLQKRVDAFNGYRNYRDRDVEVRDSNVGRGLFAVRQFLPGELIIEVTGHLVPVNEYATSTYVMELDDDWYLEPTVPGAFSNHSCNPNCELIQLTKYTLGIVAICNIEPGVEICYDYQWPAVDWIPRCMCGAPNCRGWVVAEEELPKMKKIAKRQKRKPK